MQILKTIVVIFLGLVLLGIEVKAQGGDNNKIGFYTLNKNDFEHICSLSSSGEEIFHYLKASHISGKYKKAEKTADFQAIYFRGNDAPAWPNAAKNAFEYALGVWETYISSEVPIRVRANWVQLNERTLGSAGPSSIVQVSDGIAHTWYTLAQASALSGTDYVEESQSSSAPVDFDIIVNMNANWDRWYFGTDAQPPTTQIDFVTVVLHEIAHGIGFLGTVRVPENVKTAEWGQGAPRFPIIYDRFIVDGFGNEIIDNQKFSNPSPDLYNVVTGNNNGLYFHGIDAISANAGNEVKLYAPSEWSSGSSYSHLDYQTFTNTENALMRPSIDLAFAMHSPGPVLCGALADMGWPLGDGCKELLDSQVNFTINQAPIDFGVTNAGSLVDRFITISNDINSPNLLVGQAKINIPGSFSVQNQNEIFVIAPGESHNINILYEPDKEAALSGNLEIHHNDVNQQNPIIIPLSGEALAENKFFEIGHNYPNPFNTGTNIPFVLSKSGVVRVEVYNALGKHVKTLLQEELMPGRYVQKFQANNISGGIYFYRVSMDGKSKTGKLLLVK